MFANFSKVQMDCREVIAILNNFIITNVLIKLHKAIIVAQT